MGKWKESLSRRMQSLCTCVSVASKQAREAEIDAPSKRRFRQMLASEEGSIAISGDGSTGVREVKARMGIGLRAFLDCLDDVKTQAEQLKTGVLEKREYRKLPE